MASYNAKELLWKYSAILTEQKSCCILESLKKKKKKKKDNTAQIYFFFSIHSDYHRKAFLFIWVCTAQLLALVSSDIYSTSNYFNHINKAHRFRSFNGEKV